MKPLTRGQLAKETGVSTETVRYYEKKGLIPEPPRSQAGYRHYPGEMIQRILFIKRAQELGFTLNEILELLNLRVDPDTTCRDVRNQTEAKIEDVEKKIRDLQKMRKALKKLFESCTGSGPTSECPILEALEKESHL